MFHKGETVIDLGSGAGFDAFLAAKKIGTTGRAIGVDMNKVMSSKTHLSSCLLNTSIQEMLKRARANQAESSETNNITFIEGQITSVPLQNGIADCIISNCVINLVPEAEKPAVFAEMSRLLKSGGRVAISDILAKKPFPEALRENVALYVQCVAGCSTKDNYIRYLKENGFDSKSISWRLHFS